MALLVGVRLLALLVSAELSGATHALLDVASSVAGTEHPDEDCDEEVGHECPPGCPNCHCAHAGLAAGAPCIEVRLTELHPLGSKTGFVPLAGLPPAGAELARLYRPPRAIAAS